jgi:hypothetical protein
MQKKERGINPSKVRPHPQAKGRPFCWSLLGQKGLLGGQGNYQKRCFSAAFQACKQM